MSDFLAFNIIDIGFINRKDKSIETKNKESYVLSCRLTGSAIFNTNLVYELGVLKPFAEKLLLKIPENSMYYSDARRLYKLLNNFLPIETTHIPNDSILKEFIGNGCFKR